MERIAMVARLKPGAGERARRRPRVARQQFGRERLRAEAAAGGETWA